MQPAPLPIGPNVAVVADDLIWASRLSEAVRRAGGTPVRLGSSREVTIALAAAALDEPIHERGDPGPDDPHPASPPRLVGAVVDLFGRGFDGAAVIADLVAARLPVIAVAEHDDQETRKRALNAGASRVFSYNKFFTDGPRIVGEWLVREGIRSA